MSSLTRSETPRYKGAKAKTEYWYTAKWGDLGLQPW